MSLAFVSPVLGDSIAGGHIGGNAAGSSLGRLLDLVLAPFEFSTVQKSLAELGGRVPALQSQPQRQSNTSLTAWSSMLEVS